MLTLPVGFIKALMNGHSEQELNEGGAIRARQGTTAGLVLWLRHAASTKTRTASFNAAMEMVMHGVEQPAPLDMPSAPYRNKPEIHKAWMHMQPVAHLWAGLCWAHTMRATLNTLPPLERAATIVGYAIAFQNWALSPRDGGKPLIASNRLWLIPSTVSPPNLGEMLPDKVRPEFASMLSSKRKW